MATNNAINNRVNNMQGVYVPTLANIAGASSLSNIRSSYGSFGTSSGCLTIISSKFTVVPTAISFTTSISIPLGANFAGSGQANLMGGIIFDSGTNLIVGNILDADSAAGNVIYIQFKVDPSAVSVSNTVNVSLSYLVQ